METTKNNHIEGGVVISDEIKTFSHFLYSEKLHGREIMQSFTFENFLHKQYLDLLIISGKYRNCTILRIMKDQKILDVIERIGIERFSLLINRDGFEFNARDADDCWINMFDNVLRNIKFINAINQISIEKLHILFGSNISHDNSLCGFLQNRNIVNSIKALDTDKFTILYQTESFSIVSIMCLLSLPLIDVLNRISVAKLEMLVEFCSSHCYEMTRLLRNTCAADFIISVHLDKFGPLLEFFTSGLADFTLFTCFCNVKSVNGINTEKFIFLTRSGFLRTSHHRLQALVNNGLQLNLINSIGIEKLKIIFRISSQHDLLLIFNSTNFNVRKNLSFAVALYKRGIISSITFEYVSNHNNALYNDVIQVFPKTYPIRRVLKMPTTIESVPKLMDRCIEVYVDPIKQDA